MTTEQLRAVLKQEQEKLETWRWRYRQSKWNDVGKGGHIDATKMINRYEARVELLNQLITSSRD